ncbi:hypothetical protein O7600_04520 [Micromonospora sp. WMMA1998]|uniref:hypothetical protein n=1 Tax=Micromonospora sp. WMMA1998 TaxID=3015167 RepID=UPI00248C2F07|nr:hypothetical protein [Micromonospora sp. WMMA1998]WBC16109.1 hypothetical protein O7600_04520 [Micromonospora sp. WMMA1998]
MTRPEEPTEALPTRALPADPARDAQAAAPTVHLVPPRPPADADATAPLTLDPAGAAEPTVRLGGQGATPPADADPTVYLAGRGATPPADSDATVHLAPPQQVTGPPTVAYRPTSTGPAAPTAGATAGAYRYPTAPAVSGVPAPASGGELRFGPGVPATPPPPPAWPVAPPIRPPRPLWRRVVSVLSTLLTAALLVTVGLYLWQRLRPLEVEQVAVAVPRPPGVACDVTVDVVATVRTNGRAGTIRYQWFRSDAPPGALLSERVGSGQRTATLTLRWTFSGVGATTGTATVNIIEPAPVQAGTRVSYRCPGG